MATVYLVAGQQFTFGGGRLAVGPSGGSDDTVIDWPAAVDYNSAPDTDEGVGTIVEVGDGFRKKGQERYTYTVYWDEESKRFFYEDAEGY